MLAGELSTHLYDYSLPPYARKLTASLGMSARVGWPCVANAHLMCATIHEVTPRAHCHSHDSDLVLLVQEQEAAPLRLGRMGTRQMAAESWLQAYCQPLRWPLAMTWSIWG